MQHVHVLFWLIQQTVKGKGQYFSQRLVELVIGDPLEKAETKMIAVTEGTSTAAMLNLRMYLHKHSPCCPRTKEVELFKHPHLLLLQVQNSIFKLPGGRLRPGESDIDGLKRKLSSKLSVGEDGRGPEWQVGECLGIWRRADFETLLYPYLPPNIKRPKECIKLFLVKLPASRRFVVPRNFKLLAVPLCQIHDNEKTYGSVISGVPQLLSKFSFNIVEL